MEKARILVRTVEAAVQSLYDDSSMLLLVIESVRRLEPGQSWDEKDSSYDHLDALIPSLKSNLGVVQQTLEALLSVGHDQADMAQGDYNGSIEWRMSRLSVIDNQFGGAIRPMSTYYDPSRDRENDDTVNLELALRNQASRSGQDVDSSHNMSLYRTDSGVTNGNSSWSMDESSTDTVFVADTLEAPPPVIDTDSSPLFDDESKSCTCSL